MRNDPLHIANVSLIHVNRGFLTEDHDLYEKHSLHYNNVVA